MKYVSTDFETTGLHPENGDKPLQLAMIVDDLEDQKPREECPTLDILIKHDRYEGGAFAFAMNQQLLYTLAKGKDPRIISYENFVFPGNGDLGIAEHNKVFSFLVEHFGTPSDERSHAFIKYGSINIAGFNVGSFDQWFFPAWIRKYFNHRFVEVGSMYWRPGDEKIPGAKDVLQRIGFNNPDELITHEAKDDAWAAILAVRHKYNTEKAIPAKEI